jgi:uncharacterized protein YbjT (DUF2867 family)
MKALIIGATGATGIDLVEVLLKDERYTEVVTFVRRPGTVKHPKVTEIITDFDKPEDVSHAMKGDVLFSCLGTTLKAAGTKANQWHIDYEIPVKFAEVAKANGVTRTVLLSAYGASAKSNVFYSRVKGMLEDHIAGLAFDQYIIFRPGILVRKDSDRAGESITIGILGFLNRLGLARRFRPLPTAVLAQKLAKAPHALGAGKHIIALEKVFAF